ncbi:MAG: hypothetical protein ACOCNL_07715, partial [Acetivibrio ethanolgignens]
SLLFVPPAEGGGMEIIMFHKNYFLSKGLITAFTILTLLGGSVPVHAYAQEAAPLASTSFLAQGVSEESVNKRLSLLLGVLDTKVTNEERKAAYDILTKIVSLEKLRRDEALYNPDRLENIFYGKLNDYLNQLTVKYIPNSAEDAKKLTEAYTKRTSKKNPIIENIKSVLSKKDYKKITQLYQTYTEASADAEKALDELYAILLKYKSLKAEEVFYNILTADNGTIAQFTINPSTLSIKYKDPTGTGIKKLSKKQLKKYQNTWNELRRVIPDSLLKNFKEFAVSSDGFNGILAFVQQLDDNGKTWQISIDPEDMADKLEFANTVIHEYGHYLSLNSSEVFYTNEYTNSDSMVEDFDVYRETYMIGKKNSYISKFYDKFWKSFAFDRFANMENHLFYFRHSDSFINSYASTSCTEDFAECFSYYVLPPKWALTKAQQEKLDFFDSFPEIREIKQDILANMTKNKVL